MGEFGFGRSFDTQTKSDYRFMIDAVGAASRRGAVCIQFPALAKFQLDKLLYPKTAWLRQKFLQLTTELVKARLSVDKHSQHDLFSFIVDAKDPETGQGFSDVELWSESRFIVVAGMYII